MGNLFYHLPCLLRTRLFTDSVPFSLSKQRRPTSKYRRHQLRHF